ncbi:aminotransferase class V-fold PLP-dependent enzyme [Aureibaculum marinum]|uniref:Aminotransferase class V-fold PLP-dependent enzyme n=1 Tax=Aureibaculum marinum TaxID=2487930 RepID=A0A3N4NSJ1_9FLAO|nr:aminotransferase class V-fold PLP-dependent enzyme [Aureibaculum marinum]RPD98675.1 aminotransferase class V-fold PLP-dependent enzyme [Aureibaculum marinum]
MQHISSLESYFNQFRENIIGVDQYFESPYGKKKVIYTDWTASGRLYRPIEEKLINDFGPFVANTHTETSITGSAMTHAYHKAREIIKQHVNAKDSDCLITSGTGMTGVINKFQRILGLRVPESIRDFTNVPEELKPIVFITHMEHHSNHTSWLETIADVVVIPCEETGLVCFNSFQELLEKYKDRKTKIASVTACSNVTGIRTDYHRMAKMIHAYDGYCFVDFACSAPYVSINMHPKNEDEKLDAVMFSPHKFLGGPGTSGVLVFCDKLYNNSVPDNPGGGTVKYTNPWGDHRYIEDIELREDGGTPGFLQTIKIALAIQLKEKMSIEKILEREHEINKKIFKELKSIDNLHLLAEEHEDRLGVFSFFIDGLHYNLGVKLLNDKFGIQTRGGCSCAGTYGHYLLHIDLQTSEQYKEKIEEGCLIERPGWIRMSIHPTIKDEEIDYVCQSIKELCINFNDWKKDYKYNAISNEFEFIGKDIFEKQLVEKWFSNS